MIAVDENYNTICLNSIKFESFEIERTENLFEFKFNDNLEKFVDDFNHFKSTKFLVKRNLETMLNAKFNKSSKVEDIIEASMKSIRCECGVSLYARHLLTVGCFYEPQLDNQE